MTKGKLMFFSGFFFLLCLGACRSSRLGNTSPFLQQEEVQLAKPVLRSAKVFFEEQTNVKMGLDLAGVELFYQITSDGAVQEGIYNEPLLLKEDFEVKALAKHPDFKSSDTVSVEGIRVDNRLGYEILSLSPAPSEKYAAGGQDNLRDGKKAAAYVSAKGWLGFDQESVQIDLKLDQPMAHCTAILSCFINQNAWIFAPEAIELWLSSDGKDFQKGQSIPFNDHSAVPLQFYFAQMKGSLPDCRYLRFKIKPLSTLPDWHAGAGKNAWLFLDEILIKE